MNNKKKKYEEEVEEEKEKEDDYVEWSDREKEVRKIDEIIQLLTRRDVDGKKKLDQAEKLLSKLDMDFHRREIQRVIKQNIESSSTKKKRRRKRHLD